MKHSRRITRFVATSTTIPTSLAMVVTTSTIVSGVATVETEYLHGRMAGDELSSTDLLGMGLTGSAGIILSRIDESQFTIDCTNVDGTVTGVLSVDTQYGSLTLYGCRANGADNGVAVLVEPNPSIGNRLPQIPLAPFAGDMANIISDVKPAGTFGLLSEWGVEAGDGVDGVLIVLDEVF